MNPETFACLMLRSFLFVVYIWILVRRVEKSPISCRLKLENRRETFQTYNNVSHTTKYRAKVNFEFIMWCKHVVDAFLRHVYKLRYFLNLLACVIAVFQNQTQPTTLDST